MNEIGNAQQVAFVTGGSGFVGGRLIHALVAQGWQVRALVRGQKAAASVATLGAVPVLGELTDQAALSKAMAGSKVVFHVAALFKMWGKQEEFNAVNVDGTRTLVEAAVDTPSVQKVIMVSAAAVVQGDPEPQVNIDERVPVQQRSFAPYSASKAAAEQILLAADGRRDGFQTVALRPTIAWGSGMPMLDQMVEVVKAGNWQWPDAGTQAMSTCHVNNLVDALLLAVDRGHGAYFVADAEEGTLRSVISDLLATRGVKAGDKSVSFGVAWMLAGGMGFFWRLFNLKGEPPLTRQMLRLIGKPFTLNISKARRELGYDPRVSWKQGIAEMQSSL
ncbi:MAG TPA: NAD-dependent epimerase/dehydratase family protein [Terriglobales bacterium]